LGQEHHSEDAVRDLILKMSMSLDGFVSDLGGRNAWMFGADQEAKAWSVKALGAAGLHVMGARTFRDMAAWWPTATDPFATPMNQIPKAVFTRQGAEILPSADAPGNLQPGGESWSRAQLLGGDLAEEVARLKAQDGEPVIAHGGVRLARALIAQGLVDRFVLMVIPVALGRGQPLFSELAAPLRLERIDFKAFPGGATAQVFRPAAT
jgi:dihydrofolate reductase